METASSFYLGSVGRAGQITSQRRKHGEEGETFLLLRGLLGRT